MSKLFKKVSGITLGLALCFGFSFSCSNKSSSSQMARATSVTGNGNGSLSFTNSHKVSADGDTLSDTAGASYIFSTDSEYIALDGGAIHTGSGSKTCSHQTWTTNDYSGVKISNVVINSKMASGSGVSLSAKINGNNIEAAKNLTASAADYTFTNSNEYTGGSLEIKASRSSATKKAIYVYSITVTYSSLGSNFTSYNVTVHYNDGVTSDSTLTSDTATGKITQPNDPTWNGHTFGGWYSDNNTFETPFDFNSEITSDCDIYAKWISYTSYDVTVHYNDGVTSDSTLTSDTATGKITQPNDPEWEGHVFDGWYSDDNTFETPFDFNSEVTSNCDIYAKWLADADLAADVESKISNIGEVSYLKKDQILEARNAYESLTTSQKGLVSNLDVLEAAESYLNTYVQFNNNLTNDSTTAINNDVERTIGDFVVYDFKNVFDGGNSTLKMSSSKQNGSFGLKLSNELINNNNIISSISVVAKQFGSDSARIDVEGTSEIEDSMNLTDSYTEKLFDLEEQKTNSVHIKSTNRSYISGIKVNYKVVTAALEENLTVSGTLAKDSYYEDETFELNGLTITAHYDDGSSNDVTNAVTFANDGVLVAGQASIVATYTVGEESASVTITGFTVTEYESVNYGRIGNGVEIYDGEYYIAYVNGDSAKVWNCNLNDEANSYISATVTNNSIASTKPLEQCVVTFEAVRNENEEITGYSLKTPSGQYVGGSGTGNHVVGWDNAASFKIEINNDGTAKLTNQSKSDPKLLCFNFGNDQNKMRYYNNTSASVGYITLFKKNSSPIASNYDIFDNFVTEYMHFNDVEIDNNSDTGECRGESGYYRTAIGAFNNLSFEQRSLIVDSRYSDTFNRLYAWALANGEDLNMDTVQFEALKNTSANGIGEMLLAKDDSSLIILVVCSLGTSALGAFYLLKKRKRA